MMRSYFCMPMAGDKAQQLGPCVRQQKWFNQLKRKVRRSSFRIYPKLPVGLVH